MENKRKITGRYTLVLEDTLKEKFYHRFAEYNNSTKVPLAAIDELTTRFNDEQELFDLVNSQNIIKCDYNRAYITYQHKKQTKILPVVFKDTTDLRPLAELKDSKISIDNRTFMAVSRRFLNKIQDSYYKNYFVRETEDKKLVEYIDLYTYNGQFTYDPFNREKIINKLTAYKQCREVIRSMDTYDKKLKKMRERY